MTAITASAPNTAEPRPSKKYMKFKSENYDNKVFTRKNDENYQGKFDLLPMTSFLFQFTGSATISHEIKVS